MLQLPSKPPQFTRAQIAEITRGAKVTVRARKAKPDRAVHAASTLIDRIGAYLAARKALEEKNASLAPQDADGAPFLFVFPPDGGRPLVAVGTRFYSINEIEQKEKARRKELRTSIAFQRSWIRKHPSDPLVYETKQSIQGAIRDLAELPKCVKAIKRRFREHTAKIIGIQQRALYKKFESEKIRACITMRRSYDAVLKVEITSSAGALALIDCATTIMQSGALHPGTTSPVLLGRARKFLTENCSR